MDKLIIVIPAYNEEKNIENIVSSWYKVFNSLDISEDSKIVVFNDGSKDDTSKIGHGLEGKFPKFSMVDKANQGHGATVIYGYRYAITNGADYVFQTDSDGQTNPNEFVEFWNLRHQHDAIIGNRVARGDGVLRKFVENVVCLLLKLIFGVSVPDANAPFRLIKSSLLSKYINRFDDDYNLPNIMLTTFFKFYDENIAFKEITFKPRQGGVNSINLLKISKIGIKAINDFMRFKKGMVK